MATKAEMLLDSKSPDGIRICTIVAEYPRFIHGEVMTHRVFARNAASSRAIPWAKYESCSVEEYILLGSRTTRMVNGRTEKLTRNCMMGQVLYDPVIPLSFDMEQKGMQSGEALDAITQDQCRTNWLDARDAAVNYANALALRGVHKSLVNRLVEPFMWMKIIITATEWDNFFKLRCHKDAEKHMQVLAYAIRDCLTASIPVERVEHFPYVTGYDRDMLYDDEPKHVSSARCGRISYLTHEGKRDVKKDLELFKKLTNNADGVIHASPLEHPCTAISKNERSGPFRGWRQFRKEIPGESGTT